MRSWLAHRLMCWALWVDTKATVHMAMALAAENARQELAARGMHLVQGDEGVPVLQPINPEPTTVH